MSNDDDDDLPAPIPSPQTRPWLEPLAIPNVKQPQSFPLDRVAAAVAGAEECGRGDHQGFLDYPPQKYYEMHVREALHRFHPDLPIQSIWGFDGRYPGPTLHATYGESSIVRIYNDLAADISGYGSPEIATHLHNLHSPSESDGFPSDFFSRTIAGPTFTRPGRFRDHHYCNAFAGDDPREALGTLWYHDHRMDFTAGNVTRGLAGFYLLFDTLDSGNEGDPNPAALRLPSGAFDVPIIFQDKRFAPNGVVAFNQFDTEGVIGDRTAVNGKILPFFRVQPRKYRLRFLNGGPLRFYEFVIDLNGRNQSFQYIGNDGNLLPAPLTADNVHLGIAERADVVVDFSKVPFGSRLFLRNRLKQDRGRGPDEDDPRLRTGVPVLRFDVVQPLAAPDKSRVPAILRPLEAIETLIAEARIERRFRFKRDNNLWAVNNKLFDPLVPLVRPKLGSTEIWEFEPEGNWHHPVHVHFEEGRIISRDGRPPPPHERGRKDVYVLTPGEKVRIVMRFRGFQGKYVTHCHNLVHEDHAMMFRWDIVP